MGSLVNLLVPDETRDALKDHASRFPSIQLSEHPSLPEAVAFARLDHWFKNMCVLPVAAAALSMAPSYFVSNLLWRIIVGLMAIDVVSDDMSAQ